LNVHIENAAAIPAFEMAVPVRPLIIPFQSIRQRNLADPPACGKLPEVAANGGFAYGGMLFIDLGIYFINRGMRIQFLQSICDDLSLYGVSLSAHRFLPLLTIISNRYYTANEI